MDDTIWKVTTEFDEEGRNVNELGYFTGNPVDIAFKLADKAIYTLFFTEIKPKDINSFEPTKESVAMHFMYGNEYRKRTMQERHELFESLIQERPVEIARNVQGNSYVTLQLTDDNDAMRQTKVTKALSKLTEEKKELLGLK